MEFNIVLLRSSVDDSGGIEIGWLLSSKQNSNKSKIKYHPIFIYIF